MTLKRVSHVSDVLMGLHEILQTLPWAKASAGPPWPSKPKGFTTQTAFEHNSQVQAINLRAQTRSQLHKCHLTWMRQEDNCTAEPRLPRVMLPSGPAWTLMHMKTWEYSPNTRNWKQNTPVLVSALLQLDILHPTTQ